MSWFNNLKLGRKLVLSYLLVAVIAGIVGLVGITNIKSLDTDYTDLFDNYGKAQGIIGDVAVNYQLSRIAVKEILINKDNAQRQKYVADIREYDNKITAQMAVFEKTLKTEEGRKLFAEFNASFKEYGPVRARVIEYAIADQIEQANELTQREGVPLATKMQTALDALVNLKTTTGNVVSEKLAASGETAITVMIIVVLLAVALAFFIGVVVSRSISVPVNQVAERVAHLQETCITNLGNGLIALSKGDGGVAVKKDIELINLTTKDEIGDMARSIDRMIEKTKEGIDAYELVRSKLKELINETTVLATAGKEGRLETRGNANGFEGGYRDLVKGVNDTLDAVIEPIRESLKILKAMSTGDLTVRVTGDYKGDHQILKNSINELGESLANVISDVTSAVAATASASTQISSSTEEMAAGAQEQSAQTSEISSAVEEMTKTIIHTTQNANNAAESAKLASTQTAVGVEHVTQAKEGMNRIIVSAQYTGKIINSLAQKSDQIGEIAQVIDDIADQTNLLALNAAIEAARAGEQGRGFAVVADEVRKLAERTTKATKEIAETIKSIQKEAKEADSSMGEAEKAVENGIKLNENVEAALGKINESTNTVSSEIEQVAAASEQQSTAAEQISKNIEAISSVVHESASGTQQIAKAAEDLNRLTENLQNMIAKFKVSNDSDFGNTRRVSSSSNSRMLNR
jgi:methyl-accepting chemotaxis protein